MVRNFTETDQQAKAQWRAAWALLDAEARRVIVAFCLRADRDVAVAALQVGIV